uniref:leucine-rich repeat extensin-like protein 5 n=1 Tax=Erigeron canadensis TaxID=72917 RepID=UPI001CB9332C|nr:leucine-rich repeat extensin-like protein 5 [Erigeron canadensis]
MDVSSQKVNTFFMSILIIIFLASHFTLVTPTPTSSSTWVGSKYNIECTMCASCDNPCNQQPPTPSTPIYPPPPPSTNYYYSPPPPTTGSNTGGGGGYYNSPPSQGVYFYYPPPSYKNNYPTPGPRNPITGYYPYYSNSPNSMLPSSTAGVDFSGATLLLLVLSTFCMLFL